MFTVQIEVMKLWNCTGNAPIVATKLLQKFFFETIQEFFNRK